MEQKTIVMCMRVRAGVQTVPGVTRGACTNCSHPIYVSPSTRDLISRAGAKLVCQTCFADEIKGQVITVGVAPGAREELAAYMKGVHNN